MYSPELLDHFEHPRNVGELEKPDVLAETENPACGDIMQLAVRIEAGRIAEARFRTRGCVTAIACGSVLTEMICGKALEEARRVTYQQLSETLGGLPPATLHGSQLACDALEAVLLELG